MKRNYGIVALIMLFWFVISFITNILGPLIPDIISNFDLKQLSLAGYIPMSFFLAYAVMSIPAGILIEKYSEKTVLLIGILHAIHRLIDFCIDALLSCFTSFEFHYRIRDGDVTNRYKSVDPGCRR